MICLFYQWRISSALDCDRPSAALPVRHMAGCPKCREFYRQSVMLGRRLRAEAATAARAAGDVLRDAHSGSDRVLHMPRNVAKSAGPRRWPRAAWSGRRLAAAIATAAAACIAVAVLVLTLLNATRQDPKPTIVKHYPKPVPARVPGVAKPEVTLPAELADSVQSLKDLAKEPLVREMNRISHDAKAAGQVLISCLTIDPTGTGKHQQ